MAKLKEEETVPRYVSNLPSWRCTVGQSMCSILTNEPIFSVINGGAAIYTYLHAFSDNPDDTEGQLSSRNGTSTRVVDLQGHVELFIPGPLSRKQLKIMRETN